MLLTITTSTSTRMHETPSPNQAPSTGGLYNYRITYIYQLLLFINYYSIFTTNVHVHTCPGLLAATSRNQTPWW